MGEHDQVDYSQRPHCCWTDNASVVPRRPDGAISPTGQVMGTYLHGCFGSDEFRRMFLKSLGIQAGNLRFEETIERTLDGLGQHLEAHLDLDRLLLMAREL